MEKYLGSTPTDYEKAKNIYSLGGNSGGYAEITLTTKLTAAHAKGVVVSQGTKTGTLKSNAAADDTKILVSYPTPSTCKDGGYTANAATTNPDTALPPSTYATCCCRCSPPPSPTSRSRSSPRSSSACSSTARTSPPSSSTCATSSSSSRSLA